MGQVSVGVGVQGGGGPGQISVLGQVSVGVGVAGGVPRAELCPGLGRTTTVAVLCLLPV